MQGIMFGVHLKQTHPTTSLTPLRIQNTNYKRECWLYSPQALVPWAVVHPWSLGKLGSQGWTIMGLTDLGRIYQPMSPAPMDLACLLPSAWAHNLQIQGPPAMKLRLLHPKDVEPLGWKSFEKPRGLHVSLWGSHLQAPSLPVTPSMDESILHRVGSPELGFVQGQGKEKAEGMGHKPWVFLLAHSALIDNPGTGLSLRPWFHLIMSWA